MDERARAAARALAAGRVLVGASLCLAPKLAARWVGDAAQTPGARVVTFRRRSPSCPGCATTPATGPPVCGCSAWLYDAAAGLLEEGWVEVAGGPWLEGSYEFPVQVTRRSTGAPVLAA